MKPVIDSDFTYSAAQVRKRAAERDRIHRKLEAFAESWGQAHLLARRVFAVPTPQNRRRLHNAVKRMATLSKRLCETTGQRRGMP